MNLRIILILQFNFKALVTNTKKRKTFKIKQKNLIYLKLIVFNYLII